jgi:hypothetical protein
MAKRRAKTKNDVMPMPDGHPALMRFPTREEADRLIGLVRLDKRVRDAVARRLDLFSHQRFRR